MEPSKPNQPEPMILYTRLYPRYATSMLVRDEANPGVLHEVRGNVSAGGFGCHLPANQPLGGLLDLLVRVPGAGMWLGVRGRVLACEAAPGGGHTIRGCFVEAEAVDVGQLEPWLEQFDQALPGSAGAWRALLSDPNEITLYTTTIEC